MPPVPNPPTSRSTAARWQRWCPYVRNARTHSEAQVALIAGSIREHGFTNPVLVDGDNGIVAGHGRVLAARRLGMTPAARSRVSVPLAAAPPDRRSIHQYSDAELEAIAFQGLPAR